MFTKECVKPSHEYCWKAQCRSSLAEIARKYRPRRGQRKRSGSETNLCVCWSHSKVEPSRAPPFQQAQPAYSLQTLGNLVKKITKESDPCRTPKNKNPKKLKRAEGGARTRNLEVKSHTLYRIEPSRLWLVWLDLGCGMMMHLLPRLSWLTTRASSNNYMAPSHIPVLLTLLFNTLVSRSPGL